MRPRQHAWSASAPSGSSRPTVLLTSDRYPTFAGDAGDWCDALVRGLPGFDFVVWGPPGTVGGRPAYAMPPNVLHRVELARSIASRAPQAVAERQRGRFGDGPWARSRRRREADRGGRELVPVLAAFLRGTIDPAVAGERLGELLLDLRGHVRSVGTERTWGSLAAQEVVSDHLQARATAMRSPGAAGFPGAGGPPEARAPEAGARDDDEVDAATEWLGNALAALAVEVPSTDLLHATAAGLSALPCIVAKAERGTPLLLTVLQATPWEPAIERLASPVVSQFAGEVADAVALTCSRLADRIAVASQSLLQLELGRGTPRARIEVVPGGVDETVFRPVAVPRSERLTVVQVSRIEPREDQATLLRVADRVRREIPGVLFLHHGEFLDEEYRDEIQSLHRELALEDTVRFEGPTDDAPRALAAADVVLPTSTVRSFPMAVAQALMCGLPVVAADPGGVREIVDGAAITAPPGDSAALAEAVAATLRISQDQRAAIGRAGRELALSRFRLARFLNDSRALYAGLIEGPTVAAAEAGAGGRVPAVEAVEAVEGPATRPAMAAPREPAPDARERLRDPDPQVRADALAQLDRPLDAELAGAALADAFPQVRREAVRAIGRLNGSLAGRWLGDVVAHDPSAEVREEAIAALAALLARLPADEEPA